MDEIDRRILRLLRADARAPVAAIAAQVGLSSAPVARRIRRLEETGVIRGYTAIVDDREDAAVEAFTEIRLQGNIPSTELEDLVRDLPEVGSIFTIAGDPDALVHIRADSVDHLQRVVNRIRATGKVAGTKTLIVVASWKR